MDDGSPALEVGFAIDTGGSFDALIQLQRVMDTTEAQVLTGANRIEKATAGMVSLGGATTAIRAFGPAATRELRAVAIESAAVERSGEKMVRQLEQQAATFGKTRDEMRSLRAEEKALAAERVGNTDLAGRLRAAETSIYDQQFAAMRRAKAQAEALAEEQMRAAQKEAAAAAMVEAAYRKAAQGPAMFEAAARRAMAADREQAAESVAAANRRAALGPALFEARARQAAQAIRELEAAQLADAAAMDRLRASTDPLGIAMARVNQEIAESTRLHKAGLSAPAEYARQQDVLGGRLATLKKAHDEATSSTQKLGTAQRFTAMETLNLSRQFQDIGVTAAMGMNPFMIMVQQGPQIYDVIDQAKARGVSAGAAFAQMGKDIVTYGVAGLSRLATFITPVNLLLGGTAIAAIFAARALGSYGAAYRQFEATAVGFGRVSGQTAAQLEAVAEAAAVAGKRSIDGARESVNAFAAAGIQGEQNLLGLAAIVEKYAKLTGQDVPEAQAALAEAMKDPAKAAETFTQQLGLLTGAQYEHIRQLAAQGDEEEAVAALTKILTADLKANGNEAIGVAKIMGLLAAAVAGAANKFGELDQAVQGLGASWDDWLRKSVGGWAVDLVGTGNKAPKGPNPTAARNQDQIAALNMSQEMNTSGMKQVNELLAQRGVLQKGLADTTGLTAAQVRALQHDYVAVTDTLNANRSATGGWITTQERSHLVAQAQTKLAAARTQSEKAAAQQQVTRLQLGTQVLTQQERETQAMDAFNRVADKYVKPRGEDRAQALIREAQAIEAQITNSYALADAYGVSGAAALIAEARVKAESDAIKKRGDIEASVARQVRLAVAERVSDAAKSTAGMEDAIAIQKQVNDAVAAGNVPAQLANDLMRDRMEDLPLLAAIEAATAVKDLAGIKAATDALDKQRAARVGLTDEQRAGQLVTAMRSGADRLDELKEELRLVGATEEVRVRALATLRATQEAAAKSWTGEAGAKYIDQQVKIAADQLEVRRQQDFLNDALSETADRWDLIARNVQNAARGMAEAFGNVGAAIGDMASVYADFQARRERLDLQHTAAVAKAGSDQAAKDRADRKFALESGTAQIGLFGDMTAAARGFFKEGSGGYLALTKALQVFRAIEFALSVRAMVQDTVATAKAIANGAVRIAKLAVEGIAAQARLPFPLNIAAMAATGAALAMIGAAVSGAIGGGKNTLPDANNGTGTVLGDGKAQSESLKRAIDQLREVDTLTNTFARQMAGSLRSIDSQIGGLASVLVRAGNVNADSGVATGFKPNAIGSILGAVPLIGGFLSSLFGSSTSVIASGLFGGAQSIGQIMANGFDASTYSDVQKKKKFLGITTGTSYSTQYGQADGNLENQFTLILRSFATSIADAAVPLGEATSTIQARLNGFVVNIGKIDLKGLTGSEIQEKLEAVFGAAADGMANAAFPGIQRFQKVGEGAFETLVRVASTAEAVTNALGQMGSAAHAMSIDAKLAIVDQFDSIGDFTSAIASYFQAFYTPAEQTAAKTAQLSRVFADLNLSMPASLAAYRAMVDAQDLNTAAGQAAYATLIQLAPAFAELQAAMNGAKSAADILAERENLERRRLELVGDTAAIRALDLAKLDVSNRALQQEIWLIEDARKAASAAEDLRKAWTSIGDTITDEVKRIRGLAGTETGGGFASLQGQFNAATAAARAGDQEAAKSLPGLSQAMLRAAELAATSRQELDRVQAQTAASLETTVKAINGLPVLASAPTTAEALLTALTAQASATPTTAANDDMAGEIRALREELAALRSDNNAGHAATASAGNRSAKVLENVSSASGGDAISVASAA